MKVGIFVLESELQRVGCSKRIQDIAIDMVIVH